MPADLTKAAIRELCDYSGCSLDRAQNLVSAVRDTAISSALGTISGEEPVPSNLIESRLLRLRALTASDGIGKLNVDEIAGVFRITPGQAKSLDRTFRARFPRAVETGLNERLAAMLPTDVGVGKQPGWKLEFSDSELRQHARTKLRRAGIEKDVEAPLANLDLTFPQAATNTRGQKADPLKALGITMPRKR
jgi:hypothetical protein